jgi:hypothetical protein
MRGTSLILRMSQPLPNSFLNSSYPLFEDIDGKLPLLCPRPLHGQFDCQFRNNPNMYATDSFFSNLTSIIISLLLRRNSYRDSGSHNLAWSRARPPRVTRHLEGALAIEFGAFPKSAVSGGLGFNGQSFQILKKERKSSPPFYDKTFSHPSTEDASNTYTKGLQCL